MPTLKPAERRYQPVADGAGLASFAAKELATPGTGLESRPFLVEPWPILCASDWKILEKCTRAKPATGQDISAASPARATGRSGAPLLK